MENEVKFKYGTLAQYNALDSTDENTLYFITDAQLIFKGSQNVTSRLVIGPVSSQGEDGLTKLQIHDNLTNSNYLIYSTDSVLSLINSVIPPVATASVQGVNYLSDTPDITKDATQATAATPKAVQSALQSAIQYAQGLLGSNHAMVFKGLFPATNFDTLPIKPTAGWTYRISTKGSITSTGTFTTTPNDIYEQVEEGDLIICINGGSLTSSLKDWTIVQNNLDGVLISNGKLAENQLLISNGHHTVKSLPAGTNGYVLAVENGIPAWKSVTSLSGVASQWESISQ